MPMPIETRFAKIETDLRILKWMVGASIVVTLVGFGLLLTGH